MHLGLGLGMGLSTLPFDAGLWQVAPLDVWYDASLESPTSALTTLTDRSGNGRHGSGGVGGASTKPPVVAADQKGLNVLSATAGSSHNVALTCPLGAAFSLIWVGTASSAASSYMLSGTGNLFALISRFVSTRIEWFAAAGERIILNAAPGTTWHVWQVDHTDGGNVAVYQDNVLVTSQAVGSTSAGNDLKTIFCQAATGAYATCKLGELAKFRAVLTTGERALAYGMLSQKWL